MSSIKESIKVIGRLNKSSSGGWVFESNVKKRGLRVRVSKVDSELGYSIDFNSRPVFAKWLTDSLAEREVNPDEVGVDDMVQIIRAG